MASTSAVRDTRPGYGEVLAVLAVGNHRLAHFQFDSSAVGDSAHG